MNLPGFGADRYRKIAPYVTALPTATAKINICTAPAPVLQSFADNLGSDYTPELLASERKSGCFPDKTTFANVLGPTVAARSRTRFADTSRISASLPASRLALPNSPCTVFCIEGPAAR